MEDLKVTQVGFVRCIVKCYAVCDMQFRIMQDENGGFWGIDFDYIDFDCGTLKKKLNGLEGRHSSSLKETMRLCYSSARARQLMEGKEDTEYNHVMAAIQSVNEANEMII